MKKKQKKRLLVLIVLILFVPMAFLPLIAASWDQIVQSLNKTEKEMTTEVQIDSTNVQNDDEQEIDLQDEKEE